MDLFELKFKGTQVAYYVICPRKLWLFTKGITMEKESEYVKLGKILDETSFGREREESFPYEPVNIDFFTDEEGLVIHEVKHSPALEEAHLLQVKYYMYYLKKKGIKVSHAILHYPRSKVLKEVFFEPEDEKVIEDALRNMEKIINLQSPPELIKKPYCKKCAYWEFCYG
ncbi:CRISPR-associated protein Cas4 [Thermocrinis sp.]